MKQSVEIQLEDRTRMITDVDAPEKVGLKSVACCDGFEKTRGVIKKSQEKIKPRGQLVLAQSHKLHELPDEIVMFLGPEFSSAPGVVLPPADLGASCSVTFKCTKDNKLRKHDQELKSGLGNFRFSAAYQGFLYEM